MEGETNFYPSTICHWRASNGQVAVSAFGSGCACPTAVIAICPICQCSAEPQLEVCSAVHSSSLCPLAAFASWAIGGGGGGVRGQDRSLNAPHGPYPTQILEVEQLWLPPNYGLKHATVAQSFWGEL